MEASFIITLVTAAFALIGFVIAISTVLIMRSNRKDINEAFAKVEKAWDKAGETVAEFDDLHERLQADSDGNGPPYPPETGMQWELDHTVCDQGHYGHSTWRQVPIMLRLHPMDR